MSTPGTEAIARRLNQHGDACTILLERIQRLERNARVRIRKQASLAHRVRELELLVIPEPEAV